MSPVRVARSNSLWPQRAGLGGIPTPSQLFIVKDPAHAGDITLSSTGPSDYQFIDVARDGDRWLMDLTRHPVLVVSGSDFAVSDTGPAQLIIIADPAHPGDITPSTDLTQTPVADLMYDSGGDLWVVLRICTRVEPFALAGNVSFG